jgi:predicted FMN-binding regulatory protein PaiB
MAKFPRPARLPLATASASPESRSCFFHRTFLPLLFVPGPVIDGSSLGSLHGHLARSNRQWKPADGSEALVIAHFVDGYISPNGYPSKTVDG